MIIFKPHQALSITSNYLPKNSTIIEAGAFNGHDTLKMKKMWPQANIHTFEPVPQLFSDLQKNTSNYRNIYCYNYALSNKNSVARFYVSEKPTTPGIPSQAGSLRAPKKRLHYSSIQFPYTITVPTITLDFWAEQQQINHVDFLWLDAQGHELTILQAGKILLQKISVIFTEVGFFENYVKQPSYTELKSWLEQEGFILIGRDFENMKQWFFGNLLFVRK
jgi:FkbM family methyltransferase